LFMSIDTRSASQNLLDCCGPGYARSDRQAAEERSL
jgi:hypothetical protein